MGKLGTAAVIVGIIAVILILRNKQTVQAPIIDETPIIEVSETINLQAIFEAEKDRLAAIVTELSNSISNIGRDFKGASGVAASIGLSRRLDEAVANFNTFIATDPSVA